ncbi:hypothetical protein HHK36_028308 [Tetracentron sinense]|uniref:GST N-terminal domain-containing protein n=1 Tax=Tetracentron sinense TaxID=13715 RepID=A0A834YJ62_TETSI|nr:hypothetical protein HHK36_028308 [Tetracentron sinense]
MAKEELTLLRTWSSPFGLRIVWALKLKGIEYETVLEDLSNKSDLLLQNNPIHKKIPVLLHNGKPIVESLLLPSIWSAFLKQGKEQEEAIGPALENLKILEEELKGKKFFGGDTIGFVDIAFGWTGNLIGIFEEDFADVPVIKDSWPPRDKMIAKFHAIREPYLVGRLLHCRCLVGLGTATSIPKPRFLSSDCLSRKTDDGVSYSPTGQETKKGNTLMFHGARPSRGRLCPGCKSALEFQW